MPLRKLYWDVKTRSQAGRRSSQNAAETGGEKIRFGLSRCQSSSYLVVLSHVVHTSTVNERTRSFCQPQRLPPSSSASCGEEAGNHYGHHHVFCLCRADLRWGRGPGSPRPQPVGPAAEKLPCCGGCRAGTIGNPQGQPQRSPPACRWSTCWQCSRCSWHWPLWEVWKNNQNKGQFEQSHQTMGVIFFIHCLQRTPELLLYVYPTKHRTLWVGQYTSGLTTGCICLMLLQGHD